jgi:hypothetical protein
MIWAVANAPQSAIVNPMPQDPMAAPMPAPIAIQSGPVQTGAPYSSEALQPGHELKP